MRLMKVSIYLGFALLLFHLMEMFPEQTILKDAMSSFSSGYVVYDGVATTAIDEFLNESSLVERISPLHDHTVTWDSDIQRPWLDPSAPDPPAMLVLTNFAWNHPNQTYGIQQYRGLRSAELYEGIVNHPWFHPTAWEDIQAGRMEISNLTRYYVFFDFETCRESNYPRYGHGFMVNRDKGGGRGSYIDVSRHIEWILRSPFFQRPNVKGIVFDCGGNGPNPQLQMFQSLNSSNNRTLALISVSAQMMKAGAYDQGLPPPACTKCVLTDQEKHDILRCNESSRQALISFLGRVSKSKTRRDLYTLRNESGVMVGRHGELFPSETLNTTDWQVAFKLLAKRSAFSAASRGDNLFSYRFTEVISCGSIPVVYADNWLLPFGKDLINWTDAAVIIPEAETLDTVKFLSKISAEQRCRMRQKVYAMYGKYMETSRGVVRGIIENFELSAAAKIRW